MKTHPWIAIDLFTNEVLGNYRTDAEAYAANSNRAVSVQHQPSAREVKK